MINTATVIDSGGEGPVLVFLHGFCESKEVWQEFVQPLLPAYRVVLLDLPGFGRNADVSRGFSMESGAEYVREALTQLEVTSVILVGHSMGGYVSLAFAEKYPDLLQGLVLFHSSALADSAEKKESRDKTIAFIRKNGVDQFMDTFVAPLFFEGHRESRKTAIDQLTRMGKATPEVTILGALAAMRDRPDRTGVLKEIQVPVLFIAGKQDPAITLEQTLQQCHLPRESHTLFLDQTGHMGMFEKPIETRLALQGFAARFQSQSEAPLLPDMMG